MVRSKDWNFWWSKHQVNTGRKSARQDTKFLFVAEQMETWICLFHTIDRYCSPR
jgi:hypothetical protein